MTTQEKHLWYDFLKDISLTVHRQKAIGRYILDFYVASKKIAIELDGWQHGEPEEREYDEKRDAYLKSLGITTLRYSNHDVNVRFKDVCNDILKHLGIEK
ncbi:MAG: DUF559 domain-containing protein, partial [Clostridia bacterium]|nr:DUF559 domain-containing protein [Clostridia bacterium]